MSRITHLPNGSAIHADIVESFDNAVEANAEYEGTNHFWNFVEADMYHDMTAFYDGSYITEAFDVLADEYDLNKSWDMLNVLRTDYLGLEAA